MIKAESQGRGVINGSSMLTVNFVQDTVNKITYYLAKVK